MYATPSKQITCTVEVDVIMLVAEPNINNLKDVNAACVLEFLSAVSCKPTVFVTLQQKVTPTMPSAHVVS